MFQGTLQKRIKTHFCLSESLNSITDPYANGLDSHMQYAIEAGRDASGISQPPLINTGIQSSIPSTGHSFSFHEVKEHTAGSLASSAHGNNIEYLSLLSNEFPSHTMSVLDDMAMESSKDKENGREGPQLSNNEAVEARESVSDEGNAETTSDITTELKNKPTDFMSKYAIGVKPNSVIQGFHRLINQPFNNTKSLFKGIARTKLTTKRAWLDSRRQLKDEYRRRLKGRRTRAERRSKLCFALSVSAYMTIRKCLLNLDKVSIYLYRRCSLFHSASIFRSICCLTMADGGLRRTATYSYILI